MGCQATGWRCPSARVKPWDGDRCRCKPRRRQRHEARPWAQQGSCCLKSSTERPCRPASTGNSPPATHKAWGLQACWKGSGECGSPWRRAYWVSGKDRGSEQARPVRLESGRTDRGAEFRLDLASELPREAAPIPSPRAVQQLSRAAGRGFWCGSREDGNRDGDACRQRPTIPIVGAAPSPPVDRVDFRRRPVSPLLSTATQVPTARSIRPISRVGLGSAPAAVLSTPELSARRESHVFAPEPLAPDD
jgi:hypothetical protein